MDTFRYFASFGRTIVDAALGGLYPSIQVADVDLQGKRVLVTGGNIGLGKGMALYFARNGAQVHLLCRDLQKAEAARQEIMASTGNPEIYVDILDLTLVANVKEFVTGWSQRSQSDRRVDILINNAGLVNGSKCITAEGFELTYAVNALSEFALTISLLQHDCFAPDARIIQVSSAACYGGYFGYSQISHQKDLNSTDLLSGYANGQLLSMIAMGLVYCRSKVVQVAFTKELQSRLAADPRWSGMVVHSCHPGLVRTALWDRKTGFAQQSLHHMLTGLLPKLGGISVEQGASTALWLATSETAAAKDVRGKHWERCRWKWAPAWTEDSDIRRMVWDIMARDSDLDLRL